MYARIQTWFPFQIQIGINGREWLAQQMRQAGLAFQQEKNCFSTRAGVDEPATANRLGGSAQRLRAAAEPHPRRGFRQLSNAKLRAPYYWTCYQSEWATDIVFKSGEQLKSLMPAHLSTDPEWMSPGTTVHQAEEGWAGTPVDRSRVDVAGNYRSPSRGGVGRHTCRQIPSGCRRELPFTSRGGVGRHTFLFLFAIYTLKRVTSFGESCILSEPGRANSRSMGPRGHASPSMRGIGRKPGPRSCPGMEHQCVIGLSLPSYPHPCRPVKWRVVSGARDRPQAGLSLVCTRHVSLLLSTNSAS